MAQFYPKKQGAFSTSILNTNILHKNFNGSVLLFEQISSVTLTRKRMREMPMQQKASSITVARRTF